MITMQNAKRFESCEECGGRCCKFLIVRANETKDNDYERYIKLREPGIRIMETKRFGRVMVLNIPCRHLNANGTCKYYDMRPNVCRKMDESTLNHYCIPRGCKYDVTGEFGEDF